MRIHSSILRVHRTHYTCFGGRAFVKEGQNLRLALSCPSSRNGSHDASLSMAATLGEPVQLVFWGRKVTYSSIKALLTSL